MARVVYESIGLIDKENNIKKMLELSNKGVSIENAKFMLDFKTKKYKDLFLDLLFYDDVIKYIEENKIDVGVEDFEKFKTSFLSIFISVRDKKPELSQKIYNYYKKTYDKCFGMSFEAQDKFKDFDFYEISINLLTDKGPVELKKYALVPEVSSILYRLTISTLKEIKSDKGASNAVLALLVAKHFYVAYNEKFNDKESTEYIKKIDAMLSGVATKYPADFRIISNSLRSIVGPANTMYFKVENFIVHVLDVFFESKNIVALEKLHKILSNLDSDNPDNTLIVDSFMGLLTNQNLIDEHNAFLNMRNKNEDTFIVSKLLYYFYQYYSRKEYKEMLANLNGEQRTQS
ncbi:MAG: hypothetical protein IKX00_03435 [Bacilli bacterium]|nr:hypothetical protein [Bacilli bacterium]